MSNIYIQEPPTSGKVLLKTSAGDIDVELWSREAPKACRNFVQLCLEGYYNNTIFHRVVKGFIVQGGDPNGDGTGGESIYGEPFKDEFHSRLRFSRRGLVAMANSGKDDNGSQFFFTLAETPELQNKHTIFGKVTGDTIYNVLKMAEGHIDANERPMYPYKINKTEVLLNPFDDIVPRKSSKKDRSDEKSKNKKNEKGVKNYGLLSFGEEAEEDEVETDNFVQKNTGKSKSVHDAVNDPKLSKETVVIDKSKDADVDDDEGEIEEAADVPDDDDGDDAKDKANRIRDKLKTKTNESKSKSSNEKHVDDDDDSSSDDDFANALEKERRKKRQKKVDEIRNEIKALKKEYKDEKKSNEKPPIKSDGKDVEHDNEMVQNYISEQRKYSSLLKDLPKKGDAREQHTLELLKKFKSKLNTIKANKQEDDIDQAQSQSQASAEIDDEELNSDKWLSHTLRFDHSDAVLAKDASTKKDDWHDIYDPRNPINKRKRGEDDKRDKDRHRQRR